MARRTRAHVGPEVEASFNAFMRGSMCEYALYIRGGVLPAPRRILACCFLHHRAPVLPFGLREVLFGLRFSRQRLLPKTWLQDNK